MATRSTGSKSSTRTGARKRTAAPKRGGTRPSVAAGRSDKSVQQFRDALERSVTLSRDRMQEVVDEAVERGRMTRGDANELVSNLVTRGRKYTDDLIRDLERLLEQARKEVDTRTSPARRQATRAAGRVSRAARDVAEPALAEADKLRRRAGVASGSPITAYEQLTANQVKSRLKDLNAAQLRRVRTQEKRGKARKSILKEIDTRLK
jgi:polyhydroxyalkanoate synthesis regulator phasin